MNSINVLGNFSDWKATVKYTVDDKNTKTSNFSGMNGGKLEFSESKSMRVNCSGGSKIATATATISTLINNNFNMAQNAEGLSGKPTDPCERFSIKISNATITHFEIYR